MTETASIITLDPDTAAQLIYRQFPELAGLAIRHQPAKGTDNHIFRIGQDLCARFPKVPWAAGTAKREVEALPRFAGAPLAIPAVYRLGAPGFGYPHDWSVLTWLDGTPLEDGMACIMIDAASALANFFRFLRQVRVDIAFQYGPANNGRGAPLATRSAKFEEALARLPGMDRAWAMRLWSEALRAEPAWEPVWLHGDVHPGNVLILNGRISGVIDWGMCGVGDGACDLLTAWAMFDGGPRDVFRRSVGASDAEWLRGAGWALSMAIIYLPYAYANGLRSDMSETMIARLREEFA